jgi:diguanylate cyclase (GGDEF)-like protein
MQRLLKPYLISVIFTGLCLLVYFLLNHGFYINFPIAIFMLISIFAQCNDTTGNNASMALTGSSFVFMALCFGVYPWILSYSIGLILAYLIRYRKVLKEMDLKKEKLMQNDVIKHSDVLTKILFNISKEIICAYLVYICFMALKVKFYYQSDMWKVGLIYLINYILNVAFVTLAISFNSGTWYKDFFSFKKMKLFIFCSTILSMVLTYSYVNNGFLGVLLIYFLLFPLQQTVGLYIKIKDQENELFIDTLTQAYNYRFFEDVLESKLSKNESFSLIMIDLDKFKDINDNYGHSAGNKVLRDFSHLIKNKVAKNNYFCRYGGDEFVIVVNNPKEAEQISDQILRVTREYEVDYGGNKLKIFLSGGIYEHITDEKDTVSSVIEKVDKAMYSSKSCGNNIITNYKNISI